MQRLFAALATIAVALAVAALVLVLHPAIAHPSSSTKPGTIVGVATSINGSTPQTVPALDMYVYLGDAANRPALPNGDRLLFMNGGTTLTIPESVSLDTLQGAVADVCDPKSSTIGARVHFFTGGKDSTVISDIIVSSYTGMPKQPAS